MKKTSEKIAVVGLGYVGLPLVLALAEHYEVVVGFDVNSKRIQELLAGVDRTQQASRETLKGTTARFTAEKADLADCTCYLIAVPTSIDRFCRPDLCDVQSAASTVGTVVGVGDLVCLESTVYPGVTEGVVVPILEEVSGLRSRIDFKIAYSPERINPGDTCNTLETMVKVVAAQDTATLDRVEAVYQTISSEPVFRAASIRVAEAAKVVENTQRDLNIALMNELALLFDRLDIRTNEVLDAANTKWNFLPFSPGLVGGHCIGVDPYYLTTLAESVGYYPEVIHAGRRINAHMGAFVAQRTVKLLIDADIAVKHARVGILGMTFKENCPDIRNSRIPDIIVELRDFGVETLIYDPLADSEETIASYNLVLSSREEMNNLDALILAVKHDCFGEMTSDELLDMLRLGASGVLVDVKSLFSPKLFPSTLHYWSL